MVGSTADSATFSLAGVKMADQVVPGRGVRHKEVHDASSVVGVFGCTSNGMLKHTAPSGNPPPIPLNVAPPSLDAVILLAYWNIAYMFCEFFGSIATVPPSPP